MNRVLLCILLLACLHLTLARRNKGRRKKKPEPKSRECRKIPNCPIVDFDEIPEYCFKPFNIDSKGSDLLYRNVGILTQGTKRREDMGNIMLYSGPTLLFELFLELRLTYTPSLPATLTITVLQWHCGDDDVTDTTSCGYDPSQTEHYPGIRDCETPVYQRTEWSAYHEVTFSTDGTFLVMAWNNKFVGMLTLPRAGCGLVGDRVTVDRVVYTGLSRSPVPQYCYWV